MNVVTASARPPNADEPLDAVVIGGGIAGLAAAWELRDTRMVVLESASRVGGRLMSESRGPYWLNFGGHVLSGPGSATERLLRCTGVAARDVPGILTAVALGDEMVAGSRVETYPFRLPLSFAERVALIRVGARLRFEVERYRRATGRRDGESDADRRVRVLRFRDQETFSQFLGRVPHRVDEIFRATIRRSSGEPEEVSAGYGIGYFQLVWDKAGGLTRNILGGSNLLPEAIASTLGGRVRTDCPVEQVSQDPNGITVRYTHRGHEHQLRARYVVLATPADVTRAIVTDLPTATARALAGITYGPYVVGAFLTRETEPMPYDHIYAVATPDRAFNMLFNIANVTRSGPRAPGGSLMVYSGAELARRLDHLNDDAVARLYTDEVTAIFPRLRGAIAEIKIKRWGRGLPHPRPGRSALQADLERPLDNLFLAGDYLGTTYVETAVQTGIAAAESIRGLLHAPQDPPSRRAGSSQE
jgi:oxygen-dependent protoporphyrinogen oxidase